MKENSEHCLSSVLCWLNLLLLTWTGTFGMIYLSYKPGTIRMELFLWKIPGLRRSVIRRLGLQAGLLGNLHTRLICSSQYIALKEWLTHSIGATGLYSLTARLISVTTSAVGRRILRTTFVSFVIIPSSLQTFCFVRYEWYNRKRLQWRNSLNRFSYNRNFGK